MKRFPVDVLPSHVHLSVLDHIQLFGSEQSMTIERNHTQPGQVVYSESVAVFGQSEAFVRLRILGPPWKESSVEVTPTEAQLLGLSVHEAKEGDTSSAAAIRLVGPAGEVQLESGVIIPRASLLMSTTDARELHVRNGDLISVRMSEVVEPLENVLVRVHPAFQLRLQIHADLARDLWITGATSAHLIQ